MPAAKRITVFASLVFIHRAMLMGQIIFSGVIFYLVYGEMVLPVLAAFEKILQVVALFFTAVSLTISSRLFKKKLVTIDQAGSSGDKEKLEKYRSAVLMQWSLAELPCLVCGTGLLLSGNYGFLALAVVTIAYFAMLAPVKNQVATRLNVSINVLEEL